MTNKVRDFVTLVGVDLEDGESLTETCPACGHAGKFSVTRESTGLLYNCYRDSCDTQGFVGSHNVAAKRKNGKPKKQGTLHPYDGELRKLRPWERARFLYYNGLTGKDLDRGRFRWAVRADCYGFPIMDRHGFERGVTLRRYDGREPKALTRMHTQGPTISWYPGPCEDRIVLVEDQVSALKVSRYCTAVALLGTRMDDSAAHEIASAKASVAIALDADAINTAHKLRGWYGLLFKGCEVIRLDADPKDMTGRQIRDKFGV